MPASLPEQRHCKKSLKQILMTMIFMAVLVVAPMPSLAAETADGWWSRIFSQVSAVFSVAYETSLKIFSGEAIQAAQLGRSSNELWSPETITKSTDLNYFLPSSQSGDFGTLVINTPLLIDNSLVVRADTSLGTTTILGLLTANSLKGGRLDVEGEAVVASLESGRATVTGLLRARGGIETGGANIDLGGGKIFASNVVNEIKAGSYIKLGGSANAPTVSVDLSSLDLVTSVNGEDGKVEFEGGEDIDVDGTIIENTSTLDSVRDRGGCSGCITDGDVANTLTLTGGSIDGVVIGGTAPAAGSFTNLTVGTTSSPTSTLSVYGDLLVSESFTMAGNATSTFGGSINITSGCFAVNGVCIAGAEPASYLGLTDTPSSFVAGAIQFANASATALTQSSSLVFLNDHLGIGTTTPESMLTVMGSSTFVGTFVVDNATSSIFHGGINVTDGCVSVDGVCIGGAVDLEGLSDVSFGTLATGDFLQYDGTTWRNVPISTLGDGTYLGLSDTPNSYEIGSLQFVNAAGDALTQSANLRFITDRLLVGTSSAPEGLVSIDGDLSLWSDGELHFYGLAGGYAGLRASSSMSSDVVWTLPTADGLANQILVTDGFGNLHFEDVSAIGGGATTYLQLNDTPSSYLAGALQFANASGTALTQSNGLLFSGGNLNIGTATSTARLTVSGGPVRFVGPTGVSGNDGFYYNPIGGQVGIGTTNPTDILTILGGSINQAGGSAAKTYGPVVVGGLSFSDTLTDLSVVGTYAYAVSSAPGVDFHVIDIGNPNAPTQVASLNLATNARAVAVRGKYAYVGLTITTNEFLVIDISNPLSPSVVTSIDFPNSINDIALAGRYAYVTTDSSTNNFHVVDLRDPSSPEVMGTISLDGNANGVAVEGQYAFVATTLSGDDFHVINIQNPNTPVEVASLDLPDTANNILVNAGYAYVTIDAAGNELQIINVKQPTSPSLLSSVNLVTSARGLSLAGRYLYVTSLGTGNDLHVIDVQNPAAPVEVGGVDLASGDGLGVQVVGRYVYMTTSSGGDDFHVVDISGASLQSATAYSISGGVLSVGADATVGGRVYAGLGIYAGREGVQSDGNLSVLGTTASYIAGALGIGTTSTSSMLTVDGSITSTALLGGAVNITTDANGTIIREPSDERLKENIETIENSLDILTELRGVRYEWKDKTRFGEQMEIGFIAQEVDLVLPEVVRKDGEYWSINTRNILAVVVEAVKEIWTKVQGHDEEIRSLKERVIELEQALEIERNEEGETEENFLPPEETSASNDSSHEADRVAGGDYLPEGDEELNEEMDIENVEEVVIEETVTEDEKVSTEIDVVTEVEIEESDDEVLPPTDEEVAESNMVQENENKADEEAAFAD